MAISAKTVTSTTMPPITPPVAQASPSANKPGHRIGKPGRGIATAPPP
jgi:hypothetical protein